MHGECPQADSYVTQTEEVAALVAQVKQCIATSVAPEHIGIVVRFIQFGRNIIQALEHRSMATCILGAGHGVAGVRIGTMHRMKRLEFRCIAVSGVTDGTVPMKSTVT